MKPRIGWAILPVVMLGVLTLIFWRGLSLNPSLLPSAKLGQKLPILDLPTLVDSRQPIQSDAYSGHPFLLHIWASWCDSCAQEQMHLLKLVHNEKLRIIGVNYKDNPKDALAWLELWGNPFELILQDAQGRYAIELGVYGTPETYFIDAEGVIRYRHVGPLTPEVWSQSLRSKWQAML